MAEHVQLEIAALIKDIEENQQAAIIQLRARLADRPDADDLLDERISEVKGHFGAKAANSVSDTAAENAIASVEAWITDNVSNASIERRIAAVLTIRDPQDLLPDSTA